jgi:hypothetical protein
MKVLRNTNLIQQNTKFGQTADATDERQTTQQHLTQDGKLMSFRSSPLGRESSRAYHLLHCCHHCLSLVASSL